MTKLDDFRRLSSRQQTQWLRLNRLAADQRTLAQRKWQEGLKPSKPQQPCDHGLFSDDALQADLDLVVEMFMQPTNEE